MARVLDRTLFLNLVEILDCRKEQIPDPERDPEQDLDQGSGVQALRSL